MNIHRTFSVAILCLIFSCSDPVGDSDLEKGIDLYSSTEFSELAEMHCRARYLKEMRFSLAEEMRKNPISEKNYDSLKTDMADRSRALSDSIREHLTDLTTSLDLEGKRIFNDSLEARIRRMGCE